MAAKKKTAKRSPKDLKRSRAPAEERPVHVLMPYLLGLLALFLALCFILGEEKLGFLGRISTLLLGLLGGGAFTVPALLVICAVFYRKAVKAGRQWFQFGFFLADSFLFGTAAAMADQAEVTFDVVKNYADGKVLTGGGAVGGFLYAVLSGSVGVFTPVVVILALAIFTTFLCGSTPVEAVRALFIPLRERMREDREDRRERQAVDREEREARRRAEAEERAIRENERFRMEQKEKKDKKKCPVQMETGEDVTGATGPDLVPEEELSIRLPGKEEAAIPEVREFTPIENLPNEPVPDVKDEIQALFGNAPAEPVILPETEAAPEDRAADVEIPLSDEKAAKKPAKKEKAPEDVKKAPLEPEEAPAPAYTLPPLSILPVGEPASLKNLSEQESIAKKLVDTLGSFGVKTTVCGVSKGPRVTRYELQPQPGVRVRSILNLTDDIALALAAGGVRIEAPIPGKEAVGIEVPNKTSDTVHIRSLIDTDAFRDAPSKLFCCLGLDVSGHPVYCDLAKMPHLLVAGTTGSGKSVCLHSMIISILYRATPDEVQFILVDPKKVEMSKYNGIPHMLVPTLSDPKRPPAP
ncbi:MAG: DNA translocase FtsK [Clostridia bacterium]|nr:DNA translocase FtsK [Clostridia bacterium]